MGPKRHNPFSIQHSETAEHVDRQTDDAFFEEAFASSKGNATQPTRSFVGSIIPRRRYTIAMVAVIGVLFAFVSKTSALQIFQGNTYRLLAEDNRMRENILPAQRGIIYDRKGNILAQNNPTFQISTSKSELPYDELTLDRLFADLSDITDVSKDSIVEAFEAVDHPKEAFLLVEQLAYEKAMLFAGRQDAFPGLQLEVGSLRSYPTDTIPSLSHLLGYTGIISPDEFEEQQSEGYRRIDRLGKQGIEAQYETQLRGTFGEETLEVDALGRTERIVSKRDPVDGEHLHLSIDADFQAYIEDVLIDRLADHEATKASVVALDPKNGEVLAMVSWPAFDANDFSQGIDAGTYKQLLADERRPLFPRAFAGEFPSGSTIKPVYASAALVEGIITPSTRFLSAGGLQVGLWFFPDWRAGGHGSTNVYHAIADSVNTFFYMIGGGYDTFQGLGVEGLMKYAALFGFGTPSGIDLPGEADGFLPSKAWKQETIGEQWYIGDTYNTSIGQGFFLATPLQVTRATAVFANGGNLITPHFNTAETPEPVTILDPETTQVIKDGMRQTVTLGSGRSLQSLPVPVSGKTGTAQWSNDKTPHSWFTGFAPYEEPEIAITVLIEEGGDDALALPVTRDILRWWFSGREELTNSENLLP